MDPSHLCQAMCQPQPSPEQSQRPALSTNLPNLPSCEVLEAMIEKMRSSQGQSDVCITFNRSSGRYTLNDGRRHTQSMPDISLSAEAVDGGGAKDFLNLQAIFGQSLALRPAKDHICMSPRRTSTL